MCAYRPAKSNQHRSIRRSFQAALPGVCSSTDHFWQNLARCTLFKACTGARDLILNETESLKQARRRGRWASLKSVERYSKTAHLVADFANLRLSVRSLGVALLSNTIAFSTPLAPTVRFAPAMVGDFVRKISQLWAIGFTSVAPAGSMLDPRIFLILPRATVCRPGSTPEIS